MLATAVDGGLAATSLAAESWPWGFTTADVNGDGLTDVVAAILNASVDVYLNAGDGGFLPGQAFATEFGPVGVVAADFNRDGRPDLAYPSQAKTHPEVVLLLEEYTCSP